jgi:dTDP-4-dehydrorhamnose reductase
MRILLIGATGLVGKTFLSLGNASRDPSVEIIGTGSADADIRDPRAVAELLGRIRPDWTLLAAAYTDVDGCERDPERASAVNAVGPLHVARACREARSRLLFLSTDYVFDGAKEAPYEPRDPVHPLSVYGRSKAAGEDAVRSALPDACIVRTSWIFGVARRGFPDAILEQAGRLPEIPVIADQVSTPTYARDLATILMGLLRTDARGTLHVAGVGGCTRLEWARQVLKLAGKENVRLRPIGTAETHRPGPRPLYSALSSTSLEPYGLKARPWQEGLRDFMAERAASDAIRDESAAC